MKDNIFYYQKELEYLYEKKRVFYKKLSKVNTIFGI